LSKDRRPVLLHNKGGKLKQVSEAFGRDQDWPKDLVAVAVAELSGDCFPDLLVWSESKGLQLHTSKRNANHGVYLSLRGHKRIDSSGFFVRCNADGFGTTATAQVKQHWTSVEFTTLSAGLGQSRQPIVLGLGEHAEVDVLRLRWPDYCTQAEFNIPTCQLCMLDQKNRKDISCPVLFTWNGERFVYVTDFLGAGTLGELSSDGKTNIPRPEESVKIETDQLKPLNGQYILKVAEPMEEVTYLDRLQLVVLDNPADVHVYPDERFVTSGPQPSQELLAFRKRIFPGKARDHRGRDVTKKLLAWDRDTVSDFARRSWIGFAEDHWVDLDFGDQLAKYGPKDRLFLCMAGWTEYPYPESLFAAEQAGIASQPPVLERLEVDGKWHTLGETGFPAGLPRMMTTEVTGKLQGPNCRVRLRTNMQIHWDQIFVAPLEDIVSTQPLNAKPRATDATRATTLEVAGAELGVRGFMQEFSPDGRQPTVYDYDRLERIPIFRMSGRLTRLGDVTELLQALDDRFVIFGPGDEVTVRFDATRLPDLPAGWQRSFVLRSWGYCKDCGPFTATGATIEPLPFRAMTRYPYGSEESYPRDTAHEQYRRKYNTRQVGADGRGRGRN